MANVKTIDKSTYKASSFFLLPRAIVSGIYPPNMFTFAELLRLLHLYMWRDNHYGTTIAGRLDYIKQFGHIKPDEFKRLDTYLRDKGFISFHLLHGTRTEYTLQIPPLYDALNDSMVLQEPSEDLTSYNINKYGDYIRVPVDLITEGHLSKRNKQRLTYEELNVLLKLYQYNFLESYGGVDFHKIHWNDVLYVNPTVFEEIHMTGRAFTESLDGLISKALVTWVDVKLKRFTLDKSLHLECFNTDNTKNRSDSHNSRRLQILRPYLQPPRMRVCKMKG
jgi:hypothetical protein